MENIEEKTINEQTLQGGETVETLTDLTLSVPNLVPDVLIINGVASSKAIIADIKKEVLVMKINGITDLEGYDKAEEKLKLIKKTRTSEEKFRKDFFAPFLSFKKVADDRFKDNAAEYKVMETHLESIIQPIKDFKETERLRLEKEKDDRAELRAAELISLGGIFDGKGTYNFPHDAGLFILATDVREYEPEEYTAELKSIQASWTTEQNRINDEKTAQETAANALVSENAQLNAERTKFRIKELTKMEGYILASPGIYTKEGSTITDEDIQTKMADEWELLLNPVEEEVVDVTAVAVETPIPSSTPETVTSSNSFAHLASDFEEVIKEDEVEEAGTEEPGEKTHVCQLIFTKSEPFLDVKIGQFTQRIYPLGFHIEANDGVAQESIAMVSSLSEDIEFMIIKG